MKLGSIWPPNIVLACKISSWIYPLLKVPQCVINRHTLIQKTRKTRLAILKSIPMWLTIIYMSITYRWFLLIGVTLPVGVLTLAEEKMLN